MRTHSPLERLGILAVLLTACFPPAGLPPEDPPAVSPLLSPALAVEAEPPPPQRLTPAPDPLQPARSVVQSQHLHLDFDWIQFIGHEGYVAPVIATRDGGFLIVADRREKERRPVALRLDKTGALLWETDLGREGYVTFEAAGGLETAQGFVVAVASYRNPARNPVTRFIALDSQGKPGWDVATRGDGHTRSPYPFLALLEPSGELVLKGWLYDGPTADDTPRLSWSAVLTTQGRFTQEVVGDTPLAKNDRSHLVFERDQSWPLR